MPIHLSDLGFDIFHHYVLPHLSQSDLLSLAATNCTMCALLNSSRIPGAVVKNGQGFILDILSPSTLQAIKHIIINGSEIEKNLVFACTNLSGVNSATIWSRITHSQGEEFRQFAQRITSLTEEVDLDGDGDVESSLSAMPNGVFRALESLRMEISLPDNLASQLEFATNLTILQY